MQEHIMKNKLLTDLVGLFAAILIITFSIGLPIDCGFAAYSGV